MFKNKDKNIFCTIDDLVFKTPPKVLLIYLEMEFAGTNDSFNKERRGIHLRPLLGL